MIKALKLSVSLLLISFPLVKRSGLYGSAFNVPRLFGFLRTPLSKQLEDTGNEFLNLSFDVLNVKNYVDRFI